jgi:hypothetical protein
MGHSNAAAERVKTSKTNPALTAKALRDNWSEVGLVARSSVTARATEPEPSSNAMLS